MEIIDIILQVLIVISGAAGLLLHSGVLRGKYRSDMFLYYTNLSNLMVTLFYLVHLIMTPIWPKGIIFADGTQFAVTMSILITFIIFHFIIAPQIKASLELDYNSWKGLDNTLVHYVTPLLCLARWVLCAYKEDLGFSNAITWTVIPLIYFLFIMLFARTGFIYVLDNSHYPYDFLDIDKYGKRQVAVNVAVIWAAFVGMGFVFIALAKWLSI